MSLLKAFKWKRSSALEMMELAASLEVEKRKQLRIAYPSHGAIGDLPWLSFVGHPLSLRNISIGGCCVLDPNEVLGPAVGQEVTLSFHWSKDSQDVRSRVVSRIDHERHIQFLSLSPRNQDRIKKYLEPSFRGNALRRVDTQQSSRLRLEACELWVSTAEDSVTLFEHPQMLGSILYRGVDYFFYRGTYPVFGTDRKRLVPPDLYEVLVVFLANVPNASKKMKEFLAELSDMGRTQFR